MSITPVLYPEFPGSNSVLETEYNKPSLTYCMFTYSLHPNSGNSRTNMV